MESMCITVEQSHMFIMKHMQNMCSQLVLWTAEFFYTINPPNYSELFQLNFI